ncbi:cytochrome c family protein [Candidatus Latescibacterota bacterium]
MKHVMKIAAILTVLAALIIIPPKLSSGQTGAVYVGNSGCLAACHKTQVDSFAKNIHNNAYSDLTASKLFRDSKEKGAETRCYTCHTTGYGKTGGFADIETTPHLAKVGCEGCHGPGSVHAAFSASDVAGKKAAIMLKPDCGGCHLIHSHTDD